MTQEGKTGSWTVEEREEGKSAAAGHIWTTLS